MSLSHDTKIRIKDYMLEKISNKDVDLVIKTTKNFEISANTVYRYLKELLTEEKIIKTGHGKYELKNSKYTFSYDLSLKNLSEDQIYNSDVKKYVCKFSANVEKIWSYAFTEMFNNVIDHSEGTTSTVSITQNALFTRIFIYDNGIGIFKKISDYYNFDSLEDAVYSLFKGKLTTDSSRHSGEGIFFTSKIMDKFLVFSDNEIFQCDNISDKIINIDKVSAFAPIKDSKGTCVAMVLSNKSKKELREVFDMFADTGSGFTTTKIPIKNICNSDYPVSRSQAKRIYFGLNNFKKIIFDFKDIDDIGQGFAHELFIVFKNNYPDIEIEAINTNDNVNRMLQHVNNS